MLLVLVQHLVFVVFKKRLEVSDFNGFDATKGGISVAVKLDHWAVAFSRFRMINYGLTVHMSSLFA